MSNDKYNSRPGDVLVNIDVSDLARGVAFYTNALPLRVGRKLGTTVVELLGGNTALYLIEKAQSSRPFDGATTTRDYRRHWTPVHLDFVVSDLLAATQRVLAAGAAQEGEPTNNVWGKLALFSDPWGNGFCLVEFSVQGYDAIAVV